MIMTPKELSRIFEEIELRLIASLKRNLTAHKSWEKDLNFDWTAWQAVKIRNIDKFRKETETILNEYRNVIDSEVRKMLSEQFAEGEALTAEQLLQSENPSDGIVTDDNFFDIWDEKIESLIEEVQGKTRTVENASLRMMDDVYRQTLLKANTALQTGSMTVPQAIELAVKDFAAKGINCIEYRDGRRVNIVDYVYMALYTSNTRAALMGGAKQRELLGIDAVRVSSYGGCSETCLPWQGGIYIDDVYGVFNGEIYADKGKSRSGKWYLLLSVAVEAGLFHPNCRHTLTSYTENSKPSPQMDGEKIRKNYELEQKQRHKERNIRKWKRIAESTDDPVLKEAYNNKVREAQKDLRDFIKENKDILRRDPWREKTYGTPNVGRMKNPDEEQFKRYKDRLGEKAPQTLEKFEHIKYGDETTWKNLQTEYRFTGIVDRLVAKNPDLRVFKAPSEIPDTYNEAVRALTDAQRNGLYHYTHYEEGVRMNKYLGGVHGVNLSVEELQNLQNTEASLQSCSLPYDTVLWRGTESELLDGFDVLPKRISDWGGYPLSYKGFASTSILKNASYMGKSNKDVQLVLLKRANQTGAAYVEEISYNRAHEKNSEYEILLQKGAKYRIIEAQKFKGKYIIVAEVK